MKKQTKLNQTGFTVVEGLIVVVVLVVLGFAGKYVWDKHQVSNAKAHAASQGAYLGTQLGGLAYACKGDTHVKVTVYRSSRDLYGTEGSVWNSHDRSPSPASLSSTNNYTWSHNVQTYLLLYHPGRNEILQVYGYHSNDSYRAYSMTGSYTGIRYTLYAGETDGRGRYPAVDKLPGC